MFCSCCADEDDQNAAQVIAVDDEGSPGLKVEHARGKVSGKSDVGEFDFAVERYDPMTPLGVVLDPSGSSALYVSRLEPGETAVSEANKRAPVGRRLRSGDFIMEVNGISGDLPSMLNEILSQDRLMLQVCRAKQFEIIVDRRGGPLGCGITYDACSGNSLVIDSIGDGPVSAWNAGHRMASVHVGDHIISANSMTGTSMELLEAIRSAEGEVKLFLARPASV